MKELLSMKGVSHGEKNGNTFGEDGSLKIVGPEFCRRLKLNFKTCLTVSELIADGILTC